MPCITLNIAANGPILSVEIAVSVPRRHALQLAKAPIPNSLSGTFLIDTGASCTCIDNALLEQLQLKPTGKASMSTPSTAEGVHLCDQFDVSILITAPSPMVGHLIPAIPVIATQLRPQGIDGLIGRDILRSCTLIYNGTAERFMLAY